MGTVVCDGNGLDVTDAVGGMAVGCGVWDAVAEGRDVAVASTIVGIGVNDNERATISSVAVAVIVGCGVVA